MTVLSEELINQIRNGQYSDLKTVIISGQYYSLDGLSSVDVLLDLMSQLCPQITGLKIHDLDDAGIQAVIHFITVNDQITELTLNTLKDQQVMALQATVSSLPRNIQIHYGDGIAEYLQSYSVGTAHLTLANAEDQLLQQEFSLSRLNTMPVFSVSPYPELYDFNQASETKSTGLSVDVDNASDDMIDGFLNLSSYVDAQSNPYKFEVSAEHKQPSELHSPRFAPVITDLDKMAAGFLNFSPCDDASDVRTFSTPETVSASESTTSDIDAEFEALLSDSDRNAETFWANLNEFKEADFSRKRPRSETPVIPETSQIIEEKPSDPDMVLLERNQQLEARVLELEQLKVQHELQIVRLIQENKRLKQEIPVKIPKKRGRKPGKLLSPQNRFFASVANNTEMSDVVIGTQVVSALEIDSIQGDTNRETRSSSIRN